MEVPPYSQEDCDNDADSGEDEFSYYRVRQSPGRILEDAIFIAFLD